MKVILEKYMENTTKNT